MNDLVDHDRHDNRQAEAQYQRPAQIFEAVDKRGHKRAVGDDLAIVCKAYELDNIIALRAEEREHQTLYQGHPRKEYEQRKRRDHQAPRHPVTANDVFERRAAFPGGLQRFCSCLSHFIPFLYETGTRSLSHPENDLAARSCRCCAASERNLAANAVMPLFGAYFSVSL